MVDLRNYHRWRIRYIYRKITRKSRIKNEYLNKLKEQDNYEEIKEALAPNDYNMIVTPKEIDDLIENMKDVIARGINYAVWLVWGRVKNKSNLTTLGTGIKPK